MKKYFVLIILIIIGCFLFISGSSASEQVSASASRASAGSETSESNLGMDVTRCGWFSNPTPGNFWLDDKDGEWIIGTQGGHQAEGDYPPDFKPSQWVKTNGNYGYGCACVKGRFNSKTHEVEAVTSATVRSLATCRKDKSLKEPKD